MKSKLHLAPLALLLTLGLAGCASQLAAPDVAADAAALTPAQWTAGADEHTPAAADAAQLADWWQHFGDAELSALVHEALQHSPTVHTALAALRQSRALAEVAAAGLGPSVGASGSAQRSYSESAGWRNSLGLGLDASWEPDLAGGARAGAEAARLDAEASALALGQVQVSLAAEVALAYIDWRNQQTRLAIARDHLAAQEDTLQIARWREQAGLVSALDVEQAQTATEQTRAQLPLLQTAETQAGHRLTVLTGRAPGALQLPGRAAVPLPPDSLALAFPADTLRQRPDVRQAETRVWAAWARVAQADAARYPSLRLSGSVGLQAMTLGSLLGNPATLASLLAGLSQPVFDGGAIASRLQAQQAALEQARAQYRGSVLSALQEVEDALVALAGQRARAQTLDTAAAAAARADTLARQQYESGLADFNTVLQSQRTLLSAQDAQAAVRASLATGHVQLYKALGGGWSPASTETPDGVTHAVAP